MLIIVRLREGGTMRFGQLGRVVGGISQRMLALTLRQLERDGLILSTTYAEVPPRVEYALTELGRALTDPVIALARGRALGQLAADGDGLLDCRRASCLGYRLFHIHARPQLCGG